MPSETIELTGHILDNLTLAKVLDTIINFGGDYSIDDMKVGHARQDRSTARILVEARDRETLDKILDQVTRAGAEISAQPEVRLKPAPRNGVLPDEFSSTTNLPTEIHYKGRWIPVTHTEMDCAIVVNRKRGTARCLRMHKVKKGDAVVVGLGGIRVVPLERVPERQTFEFMGSSVSSEKPKLLVIRQVARDIREARAKGQKILLVGGPAIVHTGAAPHLEALIHAGYIDVIFAGNALAAHDIEADMFGTSLGVSLQSGRPVEHGHEHHLRAINRVRHAGSIAKAVGKGMVKQGIMHACVKKKVPYILSGSVRDDGPMPDVTLDMSLAQDEMREHLQGVGVALMVATTLLSIAVGNMLPARVRTVCVDINPAVVTKLADRGTFHALGLVTDAELFLRQLARELGVTSKRVKRTGGKKRRRK